MASRRLPLSWILGATAIALVAAAAVVLVAGTGGGDDEDRASDAGTLELTPEGDLPPSVHDIVLGALGGDDGRQRNLHELMDGRPLVVNFFASWCRPCIEEMPAFERLHQDLGDTVAFVGLAEPPQLEDALALVDRTGVTYPTYADPNGAALAFFEGVNMPTTVFLSPDGEVREVQSRQLSEDQIRQKIGEHFGVGTASGSGDGSRSGSAGEPASAGEPGGPGGPGGSGGG